MCLAPLLLPFSSQNTNVMCELPSCVCVLSRFSRVQLFATLWTKAYQAPLSIGFSRQEQWSGLPCPPPGEELPDPGIEPMSLTSPALAGRFFTTSATWEVLRQQCLHQISLQANHRIQSIPYSSGESGCCYSPWSCPISCPLLPLPWGSLWPRSLSAGQESHEELGLRRKGKDGKVIVYLF